MTFNRAWSQRIEYTDENNKKDPQVIITYETGEASMVMPEYFEDKIKAEDDIKRAWITLCRVNGKKEDSIVQIFITEARPITGEKEKKTA